LTLKVPVKNSNRPSYVMSPDFARPLTSFC